MTRWLALALFVLSACGGSSSTAPAAATDPAQPRPVRVGDSTSSTAGPRPVRVTPTVPGEVAESDDLADPPPVEAPAP